MSDLRYAIRRMRPVLGLVVLLACYVPARRAALADPSQILRSF